MNREQMHRQLMELSDMEVLTKERYLKNHLPISSTEDTLKLIANWELLSEEHRQLLCNISPLLPGLSDSVSNIHMRHDTYQLDEQKNLELIPHCRYSTSSMHDHEFFELAFVYSGSCTHQLLIEGRQVEVKLEECDLIIIPPGLRHEVGIYDETVMVNIIINSQTFRKVFFSKLPGNNLLYEFFSQVLFSDYQPGFVVLRTQQDQELKDLILDMNIERLEGKRFANEICDNLLNIFFLRVLRHPQENLISPMTGKNSLSLVASALLYLDQHYADCSLNELAELYHFTPTYLNRVFKKHTGSTVLQYIKGLRMTEAKKLLETTSLTVEKIAEIVGYQDVPYFIEQFRKEMKSTPLQYRRSQRSLGTEGK